MTSCVMEGNLWWYKIERPDKLPQSDDAPVGCIGENGLG